MSYAEEKKEIERGLAIHADDCPINTRVWKGKSYANIIDDCLNCKYSLLGHDFEGEIYCLGKVKITNFDDYKKISSVQKTEGKIKSIQLKDESEIKFDKPTKEGTKLSDIWRNNRNKPFLAKNIEYGIAVFVKVDPMYQYNKYKRCYGQIYKNGYDIGSREIYGALDDQWVITPQKEGSSQKKSSFK